MLDQDYYKTTPFTLTPAMVEEFQGRLQERPHPENPFPCWLMGDGYNRIRHTGRKNGYNTAWVSARSVAWAIVHGGVVMGVIKGSCNHTSGCVQPEHMKARGGWKSADQKASEITRQLVRMALLRALVPGTEENERFANLVRGMYRVAKRMNERDVEYRRRTIKAGVNSRRAGAIIWV